MKKESLKKIRDGFLKVIKDSSISNDEKLELMLNIWLFLENYEENIKILHKYGKKRELK